MGRFPVIITVGAALIGYVAGEMLVTDPVVIAWFEAHAHWMVDIHLFTVPLIDYAFTLSGAGLAGAAIVVLIGKWLGRRKTAGDGAATEAKVDG